MSIVKDFFKQGFSIHKLSVSEAFQLAVLKLEALKFFLSPEDIKNGELYEGNHLGYRPVGGEYVGDPKFWDINESINYSRMAKHLIKADSVAMSFYNAAEDIYPIYDTIAQKVLSDLKTFYQSDEAVPETSSASWIQINYYQQTVAKQAKRELMQGRHEDGHLITIWNAQDAGMEFFPDGPDGEPKSLQVFHDEVLIMPGDLLTRMTGGDIKPMFHQVRRIETVYTRLAVMCFLNPNPYSSLFPYASHAKRIDIAALTKDDKLLIRPGDPTNK